MHILTINLFFFFFQLESLVQDMQDKVHGVPVRHQKVFLTSIPFAFMGKFFGQQQKSDASTVQVENTHQLEIFQ